MPNDNNFLGKVREKIVDEVNMATDKLQDLKNLDNLAFKSNRTETIPDQLLPEINSDPHNAQPQSSNRQVTYPPDQTLISLNYNEDEELNSEVSPQHQLFDGRSIKRLGSPKELRGSKTSSGQEVQYSEIDFQNPLTVSVINVQDLSSDLDEPSNFEFFDPNSKDDEIDFLSNDHDLNIAIGAPKGQSPLEDRVQIYKSRYRGVVHAIRKMKQLYDTDHLQLVNQKQELDDKLVKLRSELESLRRKSNSSPANTASDNDKSVAPSSQAIHRTSTKVKDLEKLIAKCKESLKSKNSQINVLKDSLSKVSVFEDSIEALKSELGDIRAAHESWTVSIAENKRVMHQEIENKNVELYKCGHEVAELQKQIKEGQSQINTLKNNIKSMESRMVSLSAAHQKERESLVKEMNIVKQNSIKQLQKEHQLQVERIKLDLEKTVEALKSEILSKDEKILREAEQSQLLIEQNRHLTESLARAQEELDKSNKDQSTMKISYDEQSIELTRVKDELDKLKQLESKKIEQEASKGDELKCQIDDLNHKLAATDESKSELERLHAALQQEKDTFAVEVTDLRRQLSEIVQRHQDVEQIEASNVELKQQSERYAQNIFDLNTKLALVTGLNADQERAMESLKTERDSALDNQKNLRSECDELIKKIDSLNRLLKENETEMQSQQDQLDQISSIKSEIDTVKKENSSLSLSNNQLKNELSDRNADLGQVKLDNQKLEKEMESLKSNLDALRKSNEEMVKTRESLIESHQNESKTKRDREHKLIVNILSVLKNLETPTTSPGSDKCFIEPANDGQGSSANEDSNDLPDSVALTEQLSSVALDRCNAYLKASQRLQAVLLENSMMSEELNRLREELSTLSKEKSFETMHSLEEAEQLQSENQALIHDQKAYEDQISALEAELEDLTQQLALERHKSKVTCEASTETDVETAQADNQEFDAEPDGWGDEISNISVDEDPTKKMDITSSNNSCGINAEPTNSTMIDSTEFEYLRNIVYQFMLGKEPLVLTRVIAAIFKFDKGQVDQVCRAQESLAAGTSRQIS